MDPPLKISDSIFQEKIDALDVITETLVREINLRRMAAKAGGPSGSKGRRR